MTPFKAVCAEFGVSYSGVQRHVNHITDLFASAKKKDAVRRRKALLLGIGRIYSTALHIIRHGLDLGDHEIVLKAMARVEKQIELHARIMGDMTDKELEEAADETITQEHWKALQEIAVRKLQ
jgi:hypothetical protein